MLYSAPDGYKSRPAQVFPMLYDTTCLLPILGEQKGISRIEQFDTIGPAYGGLLRAHPAKPAHGSGPR
jgi:hypothetical protein